MGAIIWVIFHLLRGSKIYAVSGGCCTRPHLHKPTAPEVSLILLHPYRLPAHLRRSWLVLASPLLRLTCIRTGIFAGCVTERMNRLLLPVSSDRLLRHDVNVLRVQVNSLLFTNWKTVMIPLKFERHTVCALSQSHSNHNLSFCVSVPTYTAFLRIEIMVELTYQ